MKDSSKRTIQEVIERERHKCNDDIVYETRKYKKIVHPKRGEMYFDLRYYQEDLLRSFEKNDITFINKSRQIGISTAVAAFCHYNMIHRDNYLIVVIANKIKAAQNLIKKIKDMHKSCPAWLIEPDTDYDNKNSFALPNGSSISAYAASEDAGRSEGVSLLVLDEFAHARYADQIWTSSSPTFDEGGSGIILSTPNGENKFYELCEKARADSREINPTATVEYVELPWHVHPDRDEAWKQSKISQLGERMFGQEYGCSFVSSGHTVIPGEIVDSMRKKTEDPVEKRGARADYWIWSYPREGVDYIVTADVSRGDSKDYSAFVVNDVETLEQHAEFKSKIPPREFGQMLCSVGAEWNNAIVAVDNSNIGFQAIQPLIDNKYPNLFYSYKNDPFFDEEIHIRKGYDMKAKKDMVPGVTISPKLRPNLISKFQMYFTSQDAPVVKSARTIHEMKMFKWINGKAQAAEGQNDDIAMCWAMAFYLRDVAMRMAQRGHEMRDNMVKNTHQQIYVPKPKKDMSQWEMDTRHGKEDLRWLL